MAATRVVDLPSRCSDKVVKNVDVYKTNAKRIISDGFKSARHLASKTSKLCLGNVKVIAVVMVGRTRLQNLVIPLVLFLVNNYNSK